MEERIDGRGSVRARLRTGVLVPLGLAAALTVAGCAGPAQERVVIDTKGVDPVRYESDLMECAEYAGLVNVEGRVATGAAAGAALYAAVGAIFAGGEGAGRGAGAGALIGGARGGLEASAEQRRIVGNCMRGRGYRVLN
jgi:hypothetical protein